MAAIDTAFIILYSHPVIYAHSDYRTFLKAELAERAHKNPSYSLRAFAKQLDLSPSTVSEVLKGRKNLSETTVFQVGRKLGLAPRERDYLRLMALLDRTRKPEFRDLISKEMARINDERQFYELEVEKFKVISDWYHFAILASTQLAAPPVTPVEFAEHLGITLKEAEEALERLISLGLLQYQMGQYVKTKANPRVMSGRSNEALQNFHRQMLKKAEDALKTQSNAEKIVGSETFTIDSEQFEEYQAAVEEFFSQLLRLSSESQKKDQVYFAGVQMFRLSRKGAV